MQKLAFALLCLVIAACGATAGTTSGPVRSTTSISMNTTGFQGKTGNNSQEISSYVNVHSIGAELAAPVDRVWAALPAVYEKLGVSVQMVDPERKIMGNRAMEVSHRLGRQPLSRFISCGETGAGVPIENVYRVTLSVLSTVQPGAAAGGSRVETTVTATARDIATSNPPVGCLSTEQLEKLITTQLQIELAIQPGE